MLYPREETCFVTRFENVYEIKDYVDEQKDLYA